MKKVSTLNILQRLHEQYKNTMIQGRKTATTRNKSHNIREENHKTRTIQEEYRNTRKKNSLPRETYYSFP